MIPIKAIAIGLVVVVVTVVALAAVGNARDPHRLANPDKCTNGSAQFYYQPSGSYEFEGFFSPGGMFTHVAIDFVDPPPAFSFGGLAQLQPQILEDKADVWVETNVRGPGNVSISNWKSEAQHIEIPLSDQFANTKYPGNWAGPKICFPTAGVATWSFYLVWQDVGGSPEIFDQRTYTTEILGPTTGG